MQPKSDYQVREAVLLSMKVRAAKVSRVRITEVELDGR
jgi:hypothetical protein